MTDKGEHQDFIDCVNENATLKEEVRSLKKKIKEMKESWQPRKKKNM